jgi:hypothetical protein
MIVWSLVIGLDLFRFVLMDWNLQSSVCCNPAKVKGFVETD